MVYHGLLKKSKNKMLLLLRIMARGDEIIALHNSEQDYMEERVIKSDAHL